jgi:hypothetical protein
MRAVHDPASLLRALELFALRNHVPDTVDCRADGAGNLDITLVVSGLNEHDAGVLERKLGQLVTTEYAAAEFLPLPVQRRILDRQVA